MILRIQLAFGAMKLVVVIAQCYCSLDVCTLSVLFSSAL
jgi:hypothetical protein